MLKKLNQSIVPNPMGQNFNVDIVVLQSNLYVPIMHKLLF
jgi:hypothetical protein